MRSRLSYFLPFTLTLFALTFVSAAQPTPVPTKIDPATGVPESWPDPAALTFDPVTFDEPEPTRAILPNGVVVYLLEDPSLPLIEGAAFVKTGSLYDPEDKISLAALTADLMRTGGAGGRSADEIDDRLERLAASVEVVAGDLDTAATFSTLSENIGEVLPIFADVLMNPTFDPERLDLAKGRALEAIRRENDDPVNIALREFFKRVAQGHPAGYTPTAATVEAVTRRDVVTFHERYFKPNATVLAFSGDFDSKVMLERLRRAFGGWRRGAVRYPELPDYNPSPAPKVYHAQRDLGQSIILMGRPSVYAYTPAYSRLDLANAVLGSGGFSSRIFTEVRTKRGLAYSAGSQLQQGFAYPGTLFAYAFTRTDKTAEVIELLEGEMRRMAREPMSEAELEVQRSNLLNGEVFRFTSPASIVQRTARAVEILGLEPGYYDRYVERVQEVTPEEVLEVAKREFRPEEMIIMVVGDAAQFDRPLSEFGEVIPIALE